MDGPLAVSLAEWAPGDDLEQGVNCRLWTICLACIRSAITSCVNCQTNVLIKTFRALSSMQYYNLTMIG